MEKIIKKIGYIGLGKMGYNQVLLLLEKGYEVVAADINKEVVEKINKEDTRGSISGVNSIKEVADSLEGPRVIWIMVPHQAVENVLEELEKYIEAGDIVIDGGNTFYKDSQKRAKEFDKKGIAYIDVGVNCGPRGARSGVSITIGGRKDAFSVLEELFSDISSENGYAYIGSSGAGHFVKMVHNGIEYGMMQSLAEGFDILKNSEFELSFSDVMKPYQHSSVIESKLVADLANAFEKYGDELKNVTGSASASGEGEWTIKVAEEMGILTPAIKSALETRLKSQKDPSYQGKIISAMRGEFGGHRVLKEDKNKVS